MNAENIYRLLDAEIATLQKEVVVPHWQNLSRMKKLINTLKATDKRLTPETQKAQQLAQASIPLGDE